MKPLRYRRRHISFLAVFLALFIFIGQHYGWFDKASSLLVRSDPGLYRIIKYDDGDTIEVDMNGTPETIRFIGVDTPETHKPNTPVQCGGPEASEYTKNRLRLYGQVRLQPDVLSSNRDRYDRLLRYVYTPDGTLMNQELIQKGYGFAYTYFPFTKSAQFSRDEAQARQAKLGIWWLCRPEPNQYGGYTSNPRD
jgi:endonuclease YncB( thermonuclease family)